MKTVLAGLAGLLLAAAPVRAQTPPSAPAPTERIPPAGDGVSPRFPGGPDSLRALVARSTRLAAPGPAGRAVVQVELQEDGRPGSFRLLPPPKFRSRELTKAAATALAYLRANMPAWLPGAADPDAKAGSSFKVYLLLDFAPALATRPYTYADQNPGFAALTAPSPAPQSTFKSSVDGLTAYIQRQVRYPAEALRAGQQGQVFIYFEVAETGAIENPEIVGTAGWALDAEVLRAVRQLPAATAPALRQGRPVRVYYVLPITFKML